MSIMDYIIANEETLPYVLDTRSYKGVEVDADHYIVCLNGRLPKILLKKSNTSELEKVETYNIHVL